MYRTLRIALPVAMAMALCVVPALAQDGQDQEAMMKAHMEATKLGDAHAKMQNMAGEWTVVTKMWMQKGAPAMESKGTATITPLLEGRFMQEVASGSMMGMPYESVKLFGFNNGSKKYETVWTYTLGTGMLVMHGTPQEDGTVSWSGESTNDLGMTEQITAMSHMVDENTAVFEMMAPEGQGNEKGVLMQMTYDRVVAGK